jgi:hypothetical protein
MEGSVPIIVNDNKTARRMRTMPRIFFEIIRLVLDGMENYLVKYCKIQTKSPFNSEIQLLNQIECYFVKFLWPKFTVRSFPLTKIILLSLWSAPPRYAHNWPE